MSKTGVILVVVAAFLGIWDGYAYLSGGEATTISVWLRDASMTNPSIFAACFYLMGHIFSGMKCPPCACEACTKKRNNES